MAENDKLYTYLNNMTDRLLGEGKSVIYDTNFNFFRDREYLRSIARQHQAEAITIWITTPKQLAKQRAVEESTGKNTRLYGNMSSADFERIASHLEPPTKDEKVIKIDGTKLDNQALMRQLGL